MSRTMVHPLRQPFRDASPDMDHAVGGHKDCQYSDDMARVILARVEAGETVKQVAADPAMPSYRTLYDWLQRIPDFAEAWEEMRAEQARARRRAVLAPRPRPPGRKRGRPSTYTPELADAWSDLIIRGYTLRQAAAAAPGMPTAVMVYRWLPNHREFRRTYERALWLREDLLSDHAHDVARAATPASVADARAEVNWIQGRAGALRPDVWRWWDED